MIKFLHLLHDCVPKNILRPHGVWVLRTFVAAYTLNFVAAFTWRLFFQDMNKGWRVLLCGRYRVKTGI